MNILRYLTVYAVAAALGVGSAQGQSFRSMGFGQGDSHTVLVVKQNGSCVLTNEALQPRKSLEMQMAAWERYSNMSEGVGQGDEDAAIGTRQVTKPTPKALTDEELAAKIQKMYQQRPDLEEEAAVKIETVDVSTNSVRIVTSRSFASIRELLSQNPYTWLPNVLMFESVRFELDTNRNLRISFTPTQGAGRYARNMSREWKSAKMKIDWKLVLPGKILSSGLPNTQETATWLNFDSDKPETIDAALKLIRSNLVITAESGGIKLDEPLDSRSLFQAAWRQHKTEPDVPITDAAPGFLAEPVSITLSTVHYFSEGDKFFKDRPEANMLGMSSTGTVVSAKLFPPKDREIKSVSGLKVKSAKDDKGRSIPGIAEEGDGEQSYSEVVSFNSNQSGKSGPVHIELRLALPAPDAKTIDELQAEAVALTIGSWKEIELTNVQADARKEIDLGDVIPGAKLFIKKVSGTKPQITVEASLEGPKAVSQIEVKVKLNSKRGGQSNMSDRRNTTSGEKTTRNVTIQAYEFEMGGEAKSAPLTLIIRYPQDVKRERVQFKLTALDLL